ncbi:MAG: helical backbone metal receptor, partial [Sedimenticola sp.]|nr:helical backbone metal receptor [Sedimenticola sp.]
MRVVSLIPSITETLIECSVNLVGRSRFCIHPEPKIQTIPAVAGTKQADWEKM